ncbi:proto-oncogene Mas-like [Microcaecilia unicolor]|uniref:Proto-oncogene Mas-like n=1 Tax=Microcaecilia unicolor TaxID=1415580 RepID=A0A6P7X140_9AMPH|nr:proto-oncogene Mas-like [Microcaecilia unicolor]
MISLSTTAETLETWTAGVNQSMEYKRSYGLIFTPLFFSSFGAIGNGIVIWFLSFKIKKNPFTVYILNLAVADMTFLLGISFYQLVFLLYPMFQVPTVLKKNANKLLILAIMCVFAYNSSLYLLTSISIERCLSVLYPIWYRCQRPKHQSALVCAFLWMLSCLVTLAEYTLCDRRPAFSFQKDITIFQQSQCQAVYIFVCILNFLIFTPLMVLSSLVLLIKIWRNSWRHHSSKLYIVIVATVVLFLLFALPMRVLLLLTYEHRTFPSPIAFDISTLLCSINSAADPFVYFFVGSQGQKSGLSLRVMLQRIFREDAEPEQHEVGTPTGNTTETEI